MLVDKTQQLVNLCQKRKNLQTSATNLKEFKSRQKQIADAVTAIKPLVEALKAFRQRGITDFDVKQTADALIKIVVEAEAKFKENPEWINQNFNGNNLKLRRESLKTTLEQQLGDAWKRYLIQQNIPKPSHETLNLLSRIDTFRKTVQQFRILEGELNKVVFPKNNAEFEIYEQKIEELKLYWNSLSSDDIPQSVLELLKAAANQGASLNLLTPEVMNWINQHGISDALKIRFT
ncbi:hypothetical protein [Scytonema sp. NUACC26]|uniref:hypothetical protein n=1 Tax=Scytonema sp. NUACC26 TaxID=3140176 RepID=UPI0034DBAF87